MQHFFAYLNTTLVACLATFVVTLVFSQKIKDWLFGVPSELRAGLKQIEAAVLGHLSATTQQVVAQVTAQLPVSPPAAPPAQPPKAA